MKRSRSRFQGRMYYFFDGVSMKITKDTGKEEDLKRFQIGNYFDSNDTKNAHLMQDFILQIFQEAI